MPTSEEILWIAAAKSLHIPVVGVQHGVHYGFVDHPSFAETEFVYCDYFLSWGWRNLPSRASYENIGLIALPSPWLSNRKKEWIKIQPLSQGKRSLRPHDVLFMTDRIQMFPPSLGTLRLSRVDLLPRINEAMWKIVAKMAVKEIRVLCKPYDPVSRNMQAGIFDKLKVSFPKLYTEYTKPEKGLSGSLLKNAWLVLWDEPGTGFFECLLSGVPTMVYWTRLTTEEEHHARPFFRLLEEAGLLHTNTDSLVDAVSDFLDSPDHWRKNSDRQKAIELVTNEYASTAKNWKQMWRNALCRMQ
jgi:hypothetical protein